MVRKSPLRWFSVNQWYESCEREFNDFRFNENKEQISVIKRMAKAEGIIQ